MVSIILLLTFSVWLDYGNQKEGTKKSLKGRPVEHQNIKIDRGKKESCAQELLKIEVKTIEHVESEEIYR